MVSVARPPAGFSSLHVPPSQILLALTISNKCGQAFRWYANDVYDVIEETLKEERPQVKIEDNVESLPLRTTLRYRKDTEWSMCLPDRVVFVRQDEERECIYFRTLGHRNGGSDETEEQTRAWLRDYLNLDVPLAEMYEQWSAKDPVFARFAKRFSGVRMLRQDPWETLCAFICSSNNNIARIGQMVQNLCTHFSDGPLLTYTYPAPPQHLIDPEGDVAIPPRTITYYPFPAAEKLAHEGVEPKLRDLSFGYRARYIAETAIMLLDIARRDSVDGKANAIGAGVHRYLNSIRNMDYVEAREQLTQFPGVGPKVADCILLMAMDQPSSIPVDRHVFQFAERWYGIRTKGGLKGYEKIADAFRELWGEYAGWAHSVLFTADLRAFQTYKVEKKEEYAADGTLIKQEIAQAEEDEHLHHSRDEDYDEESPLQEPVETAIESPRAARWKKRVYEQEAPGVAPLQETTVTKTYKAIKRTRKTSSSAKGQVA